MNEQDNPNREPITREILERQLTDAVKATHADCEAFVGIIIERIVPASLQGTNWAVKGIRYGTASRELCDTALSNSVAATQLKFTLSSWDPIAGPAIAPVRWRP
jgi:hypothetical protein